MKKTIFGILLFLVFTFPVKATEYLVGSITEFENGLTKVNPGDIIIWKDGIYTDVKINFNPLSNGTLEHPIYLRAQTSGKVSFSGSSQLFISGNYLIVEGLLFE